VERLSPLCARVVPHWATLKYSTVAGSTVLHVHTASPRAVAVRRLSAQRGSSPAVDRAAVETNEARTASTILRAGPTHFAGLLHGGTADPRRRLRDHDVLQLLGLEELFKDDEEGLW
jgi:nucleoid-associated protein YgaU